jgi:hypothetical protein
VWTCDVRTCRFSTLGCLLSTPNRRTVLRTSSHLSFVILMNVVCNTTPVYYLNPHWDTNMLFRPKIEANVPRRTYESGGI